MSDSPALDLTGFLALDIPELEAEHTRRRRQAVRDRFLASVLHALRSYPDVEKVWIELSAPSSIHWVRSSPYVSEHAEALKGKITDENRQIRGFYKDLGSMRAAISSTSRETASDLGLCLPALGPLASFSRGEVIHVFEQLLKDPDLRLDEPTLIALRAQVLDRSLPQGPDQPKPGPRF